MKLFNQKLAVSALTISLLLPMPCLSAIPTSVRTFNFSLIQTLNYEQNFALVQPIESLRIIRDTDVAKVIPSDLKSGSSGNQVAMQILDHSLESFFKLPEVANSDLGVTAHRIESAMETNVQLSSANNVQHSIKFQMQAIQAKALVKYTGHVDAQLSYKAGRKELNLEISKPVAQNTSLSFDHANLPYDQRSTVNVRVSF